MCCQSWRDETQIGKVFVKHKLITNKECSIGKRFLVYKANKKRKIPKRNRSCRKGKSEKRKVCSLWVPCPVTVESRTMLHATGDAWKNSEKKKKNSKAWGGEDYCTPWVKIKKPEMCNRNKMGVQDFKTGVFAVLSNGDRTMGFKRKGKQNLYQPLLCALSQREFA